MPVCVFEVPVVVPVSAHSFDSRLRSNIRPARLAQSLAEGSESSSVRPLRRVFVVTLGNLFVRVKRPDRPLDIGQSAGKVTDDPRDALVVAFHVVRTGVVDASRSLARGGTAADALASLEQGDGGFVAERVGDPESGDACADDGNASHVRSPP